MVLGVFLLNQWRDMPITRVGGIGGLVSFVWTVFYHLELEVLTSLEVSQ
jgi:hypothetical protein